MFGLTDYVILVVVRSVLTLDKKPTDFFSQYKTVRIAAERTINADIPGNQHAREDIQKQAYPSELITQVKQAYGLAGVPYSQYTAFRSNNKLRLSDQVNNGDEILLVSNALLTVTGQYVADAVGRHKILPDRFNH